MTVTIEAVGTDVAQATEWKVLHVTEALGEPDTCSITGLAFRVDPGVTQPMVDVFAGLNILYYVCVRRDGDIMFSGLIRTFDQEKPAKGAISHEMSADGWEFLAPLRKVGVPDGTLWLTQEDGDADRLPTAVAVDPSASGQPTKASVEALWDAYWPNPTIDLDTYVVDILPVGVPAETIYWSGSDLAGATSDLAGAGSAAALWWLGNDSPTSQNPIAPHLALHFGVVVMPDEGDDGDDLLAGFPSADQPALIAPYEIDNDAPDGTTRIMPMHMRFRIDHKEKRDAAYVRGATGYSEEILPGIPPALPYQVGPVVEGGTGWVQTVTHMGRYGNEYIDAPAAITPAQRDAFGLAFLASREGPMYTGTIKVGGGYDGWHKGQGVKVTDADFGFAGRWFLIRGVDAVQKTPDGVFEYDLTVGDTLSASLGFALRQQRLEEEREEIRPATRFIPYVGDLQLDPGETAPLTMQLANDAGKAMAVKGVPARWGLLVNGVDLADPEDTAGEFFLTDLVTETDDLGQITATLNANAGATLDDAAKPWAAIAL